MDDLVRAAEEAQREGTGRDGVAGADDPDGVIVQCSRDALRSVDGGGRGRLRDPGEVLVGDVVGVLVRDDHGDDAVEVGQRRGEAAGIDDQDVVALGDAERCVLKLGDLHGKRLTIRWVSCADCALVTRAATR